MTKKSKGENPSASGFTDFVLERREGERPLAFRGVILAHATSRDEKSLQRWTEHTLYKAVDDEYVVATVGRSVVPGESDRFAAVVCADVEAVVAALMRRGALTIVGQDLLLAAAAGDSAFENSWIEKLSSVTSSAAERRKRLRATAAQLAQAFPLLATDRAFFDKFSQIVRDRELPTNNQFLLNVRRWHIESLIMALRRQFDRDSRSYSLRALLTELIAQPEAYSRKALHQLFASADDVHYGAEETLFLADSTYREFSDQSGENLDLKKLENDRQLLDQAGELAKHIADRSIAHADRRGVEFENITYDDIYRTVDQVGEIARKYVRLLTGQSFMQWEAIDHTNWEAILLDPWRFKYPTCAVCWQPIANGNDGKIGLRRGANVDEKDAWTVGHTRCMKDDEMLVEYSLRDVQLAPVKYTYQATSAPIVTRRTDRDEVAKTWYSAMKKCVPYSLGPEFGDDWQ